MKEFAIKNIRTLKNLNMEKFDFDIDYLKTYKKVARVPIEDAPEVERKIWFNKSKKVFHDSIEQGYIDRDGKVNKEKADTNYVEGPKVIFLDVDGVLNCRSTKDKCGGYIGIDDKKVSLLKEIVDATGAIIILVSSWKEWWTNNPRYKSNQDEMATYLDEKLAKQGLIIRDKTRDGNSFRRGKGILRFIETQKEIGIDIRKYVILDDEMFDYVETKMTRHLIRTSFEQNGLEKKHVRKAIEKLC